MIETLIGFWGIVFCLMLAVWLVVDIKREKEQKRLEEKLLKSGILEVDQMKGEVFEQFLKTLLQAKGYKVSLTSGSGDYGADLIMTNGDIKIAVQAKRYKSNVGIRAVQEIVSAKNFYDADECWVITNSYFTGPAMNLASSNGVILIDREQLIDWIIEEKTKEGA